MYQQVLLCCYYEHKYLEIKLDVCTILDLFSNIKMTENYRGQSLIPASAIKTQSHQFSRTFHFIVVTWLQQNS